MHETQVACFILSADQENDADVIAMIGASVALKMSKIPFNTAVSAVRIGRIKGNWVINPTFQQLEYSDLDIVVAGTAEAITMVEGGAVEVPEAEILEGLRVAHEAIKELCALQDELLAGHNVPDMDWTPVEPNRELKSRVEDLAASKVSEALSLQEKTERQQAMAALREDIVSTLSEEEDWDDHEKDVGEILRSIEKKTMRQHILSKGERADGRGLDDVRAITCEVGVLPRTHGSALFTRGQTQSLGVVTLGTARDEQRIDSIDVREEVTKSFMLHYNFPPFSVGEARPYRGTSRRETGQREPGGAGHPASAARLRRLPVHHPHRVRHPGVQRLVLHGDRVLLFVGPHGCGCAHEEGLRGRGHGAHQGR